jgi:hypothetical protein
MDEIKADTHLFDSMHFIDFPYVLPEPVPPPFEAPNPESINGIQAMTEAAETLIFSKGKDRKYGVWGKAFSLLLFVHVFGDIHQPLHAVSLFSSEFTPPLGDMGGNKWRINYVSEADGMKYTQMHLLFDCVGGIWPCNYMPHPVTHDFEADIKRYADSIITEYPIELFKDQLNFNFTTETEFRELLTGFAYESFELAKTAYETYPLDGTIDEISIQSARAILKKQIALAGYRMARILERVDTSIHNAPNRDSIPEFWRVICIVAIILAVVALALSVILSRKNKDYKLLLEQNQNKNNSGIQSEYQTLLGDA